MQKKNIFVLIIELKFRETNTRGFLLISETFKIETPSLFQCTPNADMNEIASISSLFYQIINEPTHILKRWISNRFPIRFYLR